MASFFWLSLAKINFLLMINYEKHTLPNGLRVIVHRDPSTPLAALNICYDVGARDENPERTGFAHLFEHLMFGGSKNIPSYDAPLQRVGGENNAYTTNDITNYYLTLPANNLETGFWLESDRMLELDFSEQRLAVQQSVVIEEFKQRYLNQPYGDVWPLLRKLAYKAHPYRWPTIGKEVAHIEQATLQEVKDFFFSHYAPNNAVLVASGDVDADNILKLAERWFGAIPQRNVPVRNLPQEPVQTALRFEEVHRDVPFDALYMAWHMDDRLSRNYYITDLISDVLSNGQSSRLYRKLVIDRQLFNELDAYISGDSDPGLFVVSGKLNDGVTHKQAHTAIEEELQQLCNEQVADNELKKVQNKAEANLLYSEMNFLNKAMNLANFEVLKDAALINEQVDRYRAVSPNDIRNVSQQVFTRENCSVIYYHKSKTVNSEQ